jgi:hypothetical protein
VGAIIDDTVTCGVAAGVDTCACWRPAVAPSGGIVGVVAAAGASSWPYAVACPKGKELVVLRLG